MIDQQMLDILEALLSEECPDQLRLELFYVKEAFLKIIVGNCYFLDEKRLVSCP